MAGYPEFDPEFERLVLGIRPFAVPADHRMRAGAAGRSIAWRAITVWERMFALALLVALMPFLIIAGLIVVLLSRRCPLVAHERVGRDGRAIRVLKLRTMWGGANSNGRRAFFIEHLKGEPVPEVKRPGDPRVQHAFAAACRKFSVDELPQLWHVIHGDLALVGPRPVTAAELAEYYGPDATEVLRVKPGLTGLWQIRGRDSLTYHQRRRLDLFLVRNWSLRLYVWILLTTIPNVIAGRDAW